MNFIKILFDYDSIEKCQLESTVKREPVKNLICKNSEEANRLKYGNLTGQSFGVGPLLIVSWRQLYNLYFRSLLALQFSFGSQLTVTVFLWIPT